jgi:2-dehydro-3-deoxygluconokinase
MHAAMADSDYALPGIDDVTTLTGLREPEAMLDYYLRLGPKVVVLKMGEQGAWLATPEHRVHIKPRSVRVVDATGAGDAFCGSFLARILASDSAEAAARYANIAAALKCIGYGAVAPIPHAAAVHAVMQGGTDDV